LKVFFESIAIADHADVVEVAALRRDRIEAKTVCDIFSAALLFGRGLVPATNADFASNPA
jgi:hypothetical protein